MRNRTIILAGACFTLILTILGTSRLPAENAEPELMPLEQVWNDAHLGGDGDALDHLWDDQILVVVPKMKLINKRDGLDMFRARRMKFLR
jgi:hypothetical protein